MSVHLYVVNKLHVFSMVGSLRMFTIEIHRYLSCNYIPVVHLTAKQCKQATPSTSQASWGLTQPPWHWSARMLWNRPGRPSPTWATFWKLQAVHTNMVCTATSPQLIIISLVEESNLRHFEYIKEIIN